MKEMILLADGTRGGNWRGFVVYKEWKQYLLKRVIKPRLKKPWRLSNCLFICKLMEGMKTGWNYVPYYWQGKLFSFMFSIVF